MSDIFLAASRPWNFFLGRGWLSKAMHFSGAANASIKPWFFFPVDKIAQQWMMWMMLTQRGFEFFFVLKTPQQDPERFLWLKSLKKTLNFFLCLKTSTSFWIFFGGWNWFSKALDFFYSLIRLNKSLKFLPYLKLSSEGPELILWWKRLIKTLNFFVAWYTSTRLYKVVRIPARESGYSDFNFRAFRKSKQWVFGSPSCGCCVMA